MLFLVFVYQPNFPDKLNSDLGRSAKANFWPSLKDDVYRILPNSIKALEGKLLQIPFNLNIPVLL